MAHGDFGKAFGELDFAQCLKSFSAVGIPPKESEQACAVWLFSLVGSSIVEDLRGCTPTPATLAAATSRIKVVAEHADDCLGKVDHLSDLITVLGALRMLFETTDSEANGDNRICHAPSALREALEKIRKLPPTNSALALAIEHGATAQHVVAQTRALIGATAADQVGTEDLKKVCRLVDGWVADFEWNPNVVSDSLRTLLSSVRKLSTSTREMMVDELRTMFGMLKKYMDLGTAQILDQTTAECMPMIRFLLDAAERCGGSRTPTTAEPIATAADLNFEGRRPSDVLEEFLDKWGTNVMGEWASAQSLMDMLVTAQGTVVQALRAASVTASFEDDFVSYKIDIDKCGEGMRSVYGVMCASGCIIREEATTDYAQLLTTWTAWIGKSAEEQNADGMPTLEHLVRGGDNFRSLQEWVTSRKSAESRSTLDEVADTIMNASLKKRLDQIMQDNLSHAMEAVHRASLVSMMSLQEGTTIRRLAGERRLLTAIDLLLAGVSADAGTEASGPSALDTAKGTARSTLTTEEWRVQKSWDHLNAVRMANKFLRLVENQRGAEVSAHSTHLGSCMRGTPTRFPRQWDVRRPPMVQKPMHPKVDEPRA